jgi:hypothetical protein
VTELDTERGEEWFEAECEGCHALCAGCTGPATCPCGRTWSGRGTIESRHKHALAQKHANRTGHVVAAQHANVR